MQKCIQKSNKRGKEIIKTTITAKNKRKYQYEYKKKILICI